MTPTISMTAFRRPEYTRHVLAALGRNFGAAQYRLVVAVDAGDPAMEEVIQVISRQGWPRLLDLELMPCHAGCNRTTRHALRRAFAESDYVIHVEDDVLLARDALAWFEWAGAQYREDPGVWTVAAWRHPAGWLPECGKPRPADEHLRGRREYFFTCWGWATWRDRWEEMDRNWTDKGDFDHDGSWDVRVSQLRGDRCQMAPLISRAINIGAMGGTHRGHCPLSYWRDTPGGDQVTAVPSFAESHG